MNLRELAWAAGLFEGEGCFTKTGGMRKGDKTYKYASAGLVSTDEDTLKRFQAAVGVGSITGPRMKSNSTKPYWEWRTAGIEKVQHVVCLLWFGLGERRRARARQILTETR